MAFIIPFIPAIIGGVSAVAGAGVAIAGANKNKKALREQKKIELQRLKGRLTENRRKYALIAGAQEAGFSASGLELSGTPLDVLGDTDIQRSRNEAALRLEGRQRQLGISNQISQQNQAITSGIIGGVTGAASAAAGGFANSGLLGGGDTFDLAGSFENPDLTFSSSTGTFTY